ncbi:hypothetical protein GCM10023093_28790 [Nemorincola caseinilytica]|uniref:Uncharacterized protein n=2 Tax=Nemorincola caseinilytica TaxID=2054315 RepID=A0ABP8NQH4_9BACT
MIVEEGTPASDTVLKIEAHPELGFNFPYYLRIPKGVNRKSASYLLVETNNSGNNDTFAHHERETYKEIIRNSLGSSLCEGLKVPFLMPVFPRPAKEWEIYTHAYDKDAAHIKKGPMKRLDLQLIAMCAHAKGVLQWYGISVAEKILMNGFSASGTFANRFTAIHPERVAGVACGGINGIVILPIDKRNGNTLDYPIGISDLKKIFGKEFDLKVYRTVPQFIYMGALDDNDAVTFDDAYSNAERELVFGQLSSKMLPDRFSGCQAIYTENNVNATFKTYPHIGHGTDRLIYNEVLAFFTNIIGTGQ